uniref:Uncharacterized protein n=1 Tax=Arundo donax TaxID=35708 RepID=A0A0A8Y193_ARUDO
MTAQEPANRENTH